jgi:hypothetical protein
MRKAGNKSATDGKRKKTSKSSILKELDPKKSVENVKGGGGRITDGHPLKGTL